MLDHKYFRCQTCGRLVTDRIIKRGDCAGHRLKYAFRVSLWEWIAVKLGIIR